MNPPGEGGAFAPKQDDEDQGNEDLDQADTRGCRPGPRGVWAVAPAVSTPHCLRGTRQDLPCTSAGEPRTLRLSDQELGQLHRRPHETAEMYVVRLITQRRPAPVGQRRARSCPIGR